MKTFLFNYLIFTIKTNIYHDYNVAVIQRVLLCLAEKRNEKKYYE